MIVDKIGEGHYQTRSGLPVSIYALDCGGKYPVHGAILKENKRDIHIWKDDGFWQPESIENDLDLIPVAQPLPDLKQERPVDVGIPYTNEAERKAAIKQAESYGYKEQAHNKESYQIGEDNCIWLFNHTDWFDVKLNEDDKTIPLDRSFMEAEEPVVKKNFTTENFTFPTSDYTKTVNEDGTILLTPIDKEYQANYKKALQFLDKTPENVMWPHSDLAKILVEFLNSVK